MRLNKDQKEFLIQCIAEGLKPAEINARAALFADPFKVRRQQVDYYRDQCEIDIKDLQEQQKFKALNTGLALREVRVERLALLAKMIEDDLMGGKMWLDQKKGVGSGPIAEIWDYLEFNRGQVEAYRGLLDDIAKEIGDRSIKADLITSNDGEFRIHFISEAAKEDDEA